MRLPNTVIFVWLVLSACGPRKHIAAIPVHCAAGQPNGAICFVTTPGPVVIQTNAK